MSDYVLGLDLGPNSVGWAMLNLNASGEIDGFFDTTHAGHPPMGVRVFEAGLHNFGTAKEESLNQKRRLARSMRRNHARRNARRRAVRSLLQDAGLLPRDRQELAAVFQTDPYELRARALDEPLEPYELGRAIYHLAQRRGFKSNRKSGNAKEDKGILGLLGELARQIEESGSRTLGEYLFRLENQSSELGRVRLRNRHTRRDMYVEEFKRIIESQRPHHGAILTDDVVAHLDHYLFYQHPFEVTEERRRHTPSRANLHRAPSVKPCPLEREEKVCPKGEWIAQRFRLLKEVNNLRIAVRGSRERPLTREEREIILEKLSGTEKQSFDALRKLLAGKIGVDPDHIVFNLERGDRRHLQGNIVEHKLATAFGRKQWAALDDIEKETIRDALLHEEDPGKLKQFMAQHGVKADKLDKLIAWNPPDGYVGFSKLALEKIVPFLEQGLNEHEAIEKAYPDRSAAKEMPLLPVIDSPDLPTDLQQITNPVVRRALVETRKVVNALIREHGKPARIVVELARDMKQGPEGRRRISRQQRQREQERQEALSRIREFGGNPYSRRDVERWFLWKEQGEHCLYTGRPIPATELFQGGEWEVDHILPRWQSLDDSYMNKALVHRSANLDKGDRTPMQWLGENSQRYVQLMDRARDLVKRCGFPVPKYARLRTPEVDSEAFAERQLNDTRYITVAVTRYLQLLYPPELRVGQKAVLSSRGSLTSELRRQWGLNNVLDDILDKEGKPILARTSGDLEVKSRADHRHHAIDAVVIALSSRNLLKRYQDHWKKRQQVGVRLEFDRPWPDFQADVARHANSIVVSHRPIRKVSGPLHEETFYGAIDPGGNRFVTRKELPALTGKSVYAIRDAKIRELVMNRLYACGWDGESNDLPKGWLEEPLTMPSGVPIRKVRIESTVNNAIPLGHRYAVSGNNHHMEIYRMARNDGSPGYKAAVIPMFEAVRRIHPPKGECARPLVGATVEDGWQLQMSLCRKDTVQLYNPGTGERTYCVVQAMAGSSEPSTTIDLYLRDVRDSRPASEGNKSPFLRLKSFKHWRALCIRKVQVDPLGRVFPAGD